MEQLALIGAAKPHYEDLIRDYMSLWETKKSLQKDIKDRGIVYEEYTATGIEVKKNNPSVKDLVAINKQMLSLLKELGLTTSKVGDDGDYDL